MPPKISFNAEEKTFIDEQFSDPKLYDKDNVIPLKFFEKFNRQIGYSTLRLQYKSKNVFQILLHL